MYKIYIYALSALLLLPSCSKPDNLEPTDELLSFTIDPANEKQVIRNFGASDAWSCQFVGKNWPVEKRDQIADWLFSREMDEAGNPKGIGLSLWRFNVGAGTAEQGDASDIQDEWRRAETFLNADGTYDWEKQSGQQWFLQAARERGVHQFVAFVNSPPVFFTKNGKGYSAPDNMANLKEDYFDDFAGFITDVLQYFQQQGLAFDYISPVNEPQWNWDNPGQEGSSYRNKDIYEVVNELDESLLQKGLNAKIEIPEAGKITYLYPEESLPERDNQIFEFFDPSGDYYLGDLPSVAHKVAGHSYFTTYPETQLKGYRSLLKEHIDAVDPNLEFWMSEYCILEDNPQIKGNGRDLSIGPALYMAKVIHYDLTFADASAWQWWIAVSPYDYKDGLIYIDHNKFNGEIYDSKMLWALGNFSRFIKPGMKRIDVQETSAINQDAVLVSAYSDKDQLVTVLINTGYQNKMIDLNMKGFSIGNFKMYITSVKEEENLKYMGETEVNGPIELPSRSIVTLVSEL